MLSDQPTRLGVIVGSLRSGSYSRRIAKALIERAPAGWSGAIIEIGDLPLYNQDLDATPPEQWERFRLEVSRCDALLFVTPEYNRSIPGVLKNATDIGSRPQGANIFAKKPAAIVSTSPYPTGGMAANHALRLSFIYLDLAVMQMPEAYLRGADTLVDEHGCVTSAEGEKMLVDFMAAFAAWTARVGGAEPEPFETFMAHREQASTAYINGDADPLTALSTAHDPASFFPPSGARVIGAAAIVEANRQGAAAFAPGSSGRFEILASGSGRDFAWWSGIQHADARLAGKPDPVPMRLRTTEIFRNEGGAWKLVHRHADFLKDDR